MNRISTLTELEALYAKPSDASIAKEITKLNDEYKRLIASSSFLTIASIGSEGMDC